MKVSLAMIHVPEETTGSAVLGNAQIEPLAVTDQRILWVWAERKLLDFPNFCFDFQVGKFVDCHVPYFG
jgi:hypothetical protein